MADDPAATHSDTSSDPTPFIRTYAKDVARLTGKQPVAVHRDTPEPGVVLPTVDPTQSFNNASPREFPQEVISVGASDTVANLNSGSSPDLSNREVRRDEILTRLRAKVGRGDDEHEIHAPAPTYTTIPLPPPPPPRIPTPAPPVYIAPSTPPIPVPPPAPHKTHKQAFTFFGHHGTKGVESDPSPSNIHTFKSDFSDHIDDKKATTFSVLAAQSDSKENLAHEPRPAVTSSKKRNVQFILGGIALVIFTIGIAGGTYWFVALRTPSTGVPFVVSSLIFADEKVEINGEMGDELLLALAALGQGPSVKGNVVVTYAVTSTDGKSGVITAPQPGGQTIKKMFQSAPDILLRNISDESTFGIVQAGESNAAFFILDVTSYERTFAGMLGWEPKIATDLSVLYPAYQEAPISTSTPRVTSSPRFSDSSVANHDVRILKDDSGKTILIYGYRDKQTLIIARDEAAFSSILIRLGTADGE
ncbi:MAG: hypothetical protein AB203_03815 [Parcubacteria bacterium C7867-008]|nr:MAG: hypothetical protein AB203_03815 [Parcubacteria bacterium C7867-008]